MRAHGQNNRKQAVYRSQTPPASECASSLPQAQFLQQLRNHSKAFPGPPLPPNCLCMVTKVVHLACSPKLECGGGVPLTLLVWASHCVFCIPPALQLLSPLLKCFLFINVRWSLNATSSGSLSCLLLTYVVTLCGKTQPNGTKGAQTIAICLQTQLPQTAITSQTMWTGSQARHPLRQAHKCQCHLIQQDAFSGHSRSAEKHRGELPDMKLAICREAKGNFL